MYFDWNAEMIRMTGDKIDTICNHEKNYIPFYYIFGSVFVFQFPNIQTGGVSVSNCMNETTGLSTATSLSFLYGISYEDYDNSISKEWLHEAVSIVEDYKANSKYWQVGLTGRLSRRFTIRRRAA